MTKDDAEESAVSDVFGVKTPTATEQADLMFAHNDLPDNLFSSWTLSGTDFVQHGSNGQLIPLEGLVDEHAPNINNYLDPRPEIRSIMTATDDTMFIRNYDNYLAGLE
ncbi:hypothetical protein [Jeotgalibaca sp. A122]|uniref:hypothetical protein n=1 Tax=Jeotgalibaca sp. A122 TaxID=3457322 RepID=UPI003FD39915